MHGKAAFHPWSVNLYVCAWTAIVCQRFSRAFKVNYSCYIWIHANGSFPSPGTDPGYLWQRHLQEASFHPSSSCFSPTPALRPCYPPSGIVSIVAIPWRVAAHSRVACYPIMHSQGHIGWEDERWWGWTDGWKVGIPSYSCSDVKFRRQHSAAGGDEKRFPVVKDAITNRTNLAHTHLLVRLGHSSCALNGAVKHDGHTKHYRRMQQYFYHVIISKY